MEPVAGQIITLKHYYTRLSLAVMLAEFVFFALYREIGAFRRFSALLFLVLALGVGLAVYVGIELIRLRGRLNLRLMFALTTIIGIALAMLSEQFAISAHQRQMVEVVTQLGGQVRYNSHGSNDPYWLSTRSGWILPRWLISVCGQDLFQDVSTVSMMGLSDVQISETSLSPLNGIESISVGAFSLFEQGTVTLATKLGQLDRLTELCLYQTNISSKCITQLQKLLNLKTLIFANCNFAPEALNQVAQMKTLEFIRLDQCKPNLAELKRIRRLHRRRQSQMDGCILANRNRLVRTDTNTQDG